MMRPFGLKGWLLLSALTVAGPAISPAFANGGGSGSGASGSDTSIIKPEDNQDATGSVGGTATPEEQTGGATSGQDSTGAVTPSAKPPILYPCPEGYARFDDYNRCSRP